MNVIENSSSQEKADMSIDVYSLCDHKYSIQEDRKILLQQSELHGVQHLSTISDQLDKSENDSEKSLSEISTDSTSNKSKECKDTNAIMLSEPLISIIPLTTDYLLDSNMSQSRLMSYVDSFFINERDVVPVPVGPSTSIGNNCNSNGTSTGIYIL